jgi:hypothetical protein
LRSRRTACGVGRPPSNGVRGSIVMVRPGGHEVEALMMVEVVASVKVVASSRTSGGLLVSVAGAWTTAGLAVGEGCCWKRIGKRACLGDRSMIVKSKEVGKDDFTNNKH